MPCLEIYSRWSLPPLCLEAKRCLEFNSHGSNTKYRLFPIYHDTLYLVLYYPIVSLCHNSLAVENVDFSILSIHKSSTELDMSRSIESSKNVARRINRHWPKHRWITSAKYIKILVLLFLKSSLHTSSSNAEVHFCTSCVFSHSAKSLIETDKNVVV